MYQSMMYSSEVQREREFRDKEKKREREKCMLHLHCGHYIAFDPNFCGTDIEQEKNPSSNVRMSFQVGERKKKEREKKREIVGDRCKY